MLGELREEKGEATIDAEILRCSQEREFSFPMRMQCPVQPDFNTA